MGVVKIYLKLLYYSALKRDHCPLTLEAVHSAQMTALTQLYK